MKVILKNGLGASVVVLGAGEKIPCVSQKLAFKMRDVESATRVVAKVLRHGMLVVLQSTTYPGTTTEFVLLAISWPSPTATCVDSAMNAGKCKEDSLHSERVSAIVPTGRLSIGGTDEWHPVTAVCGPQSYYLHDAYMTRSVIPGAR